MYTTARALASAIVLAAAVLSGCATPALHPNGVVALHRAGGLAAAPARLVEVATVRGPAAPATTTIAHSACPAATTTSGGGIATTLIGGGKPPSSLHADGTAPAAGVGRGPAGTGSVPAGWIGLGATGGQLVIGGVTTSYAMCLHGMPFGRSTVIVATVPGPAVATTTVRATASCPSGAILLGGGGLATVTRGSASPSLHLIKSYPSDETGAAVGASASDPRSWSAVADAGGRTGSGVQTSAFAICGPARGAHTTVAVSRSPGPLAPGGATRTTADCPTATELISGGAATGPASGAPQQGLHLTGNFPSDSAGVGVGSSPAAEAANSWTARSEAGGQGSPGGTATTAFAVCLKS